MKCKQVKITVEPDIATAFKTACKRSGVSMTVELTEFMRERTNTLCTSQERKYSHLEKRGGRRKEVAKYILLLEAVRDAEEDYKNRIPENLINGPAYESAEQAIDSLNDAIDILGEAFSC